MNMFWTITLFLVFINPSSAQLWCPGSSIPAVCCSKLLDGTHTNDYAKFETSFLSPIYGYNDIEIDVEPMTLEDCYEACKVSFGHFSLKHLSYINSRGHHLQGSVFPKSFLHI